MSAEIAGFTENVTVQSSDGFHISAESVTSSLTRTDIRAQGPVNVRAPFGVLEAGNMHLTQSGEDLLMVFDNKVKLVYLP